MAIGDDRIERRIEIGLDTRQRPLAVVIERCDRRVQAALARRGARNVLGHAAEMLGQQPLS